MKINSINNKLFSDAKTPIFGAIKGTDNLNYSYSRYKDTFGQTTFNDVLTKIIGLVYNNSDKLTKLSEDQAELVKRGEDFNSLFSRLIVKDPEDKEFHPIIDLSIEYERYLPYMKYGNANSPDAPKLLVKASSDQVCVDNDIAIVSLRSINDVFEIIKRTAEKLCEALKMTPKAIAGPLEQAMFRLGIQPPPKPLAEVVLDDFSNLSRIPKEQAQLLIPELIGKMAIAGKPATERELLEIAQEICNSTANIDEFFEQYWRAVAIENSKKLLAS